MFKCNIAHFHIHRPSPQRILLMDIAFHFSMSFLYCKETRWAPANRAHGTKKGNTKEIPVASVVPLTLELFVGLCKQLKNLFQRKLCCTARFFLTSLLAWIPQSVHFDFFWKSVLISLEWDEIWYSQWYWILFWNIQRHWANRFSKVCLTVRHSTITSTGMLKTSK